MIIRLWHGWTAPENADAYEALLKAEIFPGIAAKNIAGYQGIELLRRNLDGEVEFITMMRFDSLQSVKDFTGQDYETAYVPEKAKALLRRFDERSQHYERRETLHYTHKSSRIHQKAVMGNAEVVTKFITEFLGQGNLGAADETAHERIQGITGLKPTGSIDGRPEYKQIIAAFVDAFQPIPGQPLKIIDQFESANGTRVVTRFQSPQRHVKDFFGVAATERVILFDETHVARLRDGLIVENIVSATNLEFEMLMAPVLTPLILK